jgi:hypothetical protein
MSGADMSLAKWPYGSLKRSILGCISIRDGSPGFEIWAASPDWARVVGEPSGLAVRNDCATGCVDDVVVDAVD